MNRSTTTWSRPTLPSSADSASETADGSASPRKAATTVWASPSRSGSADAVGEGRKDGDAPSSGWASPSSGEQEEGRRRTRGGPDAEGRRHRISMGVGLGSARTRSSVRAHASAFQQKAQLASQPSPSVSHSDADDKSSSPSSSKSVAKTRSVFHSSSPALLGARVEKTQSPPLSPSSTSTSDAAGEGDEPESAEAKRQRYERMRQNVLAEIVQTEREYIEDCEILVEVFLLPLQFQQKMVGIDKMDIDTLFSAIETIIPLNKQVLKDLETRQRQSISSDATISVGDIFIKLASFFKMYMSYCSNQPHALKKLEELTSKNEKFKRYLDVAHSDPRCRGIQIGGFLIKPIQRLCKYPLLLRELLKYTDESNPDYDTIQEAKQKIDEVVDYVNEGKRVAERQNRIVEIQNAMTDLTMELILPTRRFVRAGSTTLRHTITGKAQDRHLILFNDLILLTRLTSQRPSYQFKLAIPFSEARFIVVSDQEKITNAFEVSWKDKRYIFSCESKEEQAQWMADFKQLTKEMKLRQLKLAKEQQAAAAKASSSSSTSSSPPSSSASAASSSPSI
eukprot:CAMPEP_0174238998 /NCGR_PEP_ID=MMETSP0417-20130205/13156_1 /TAXON_ID=242541 /ORGANISM="Mayorella sp, Strain BSH-02190019" /LENGTH=564 /DNA_ID=CAMNT_0015317893 /DNA_START=138 /DNA_END=1829 /DNA_ORIENTATION=+